MRVVLCCCVMLAAGTAASRALAQEVNQQTEQAMKAAAARVAPCVVKIETAGGREIATGGLPRRTGMPGLTSDGVRKGVGPTTGLIVGSDGTIISSAFNFAHNPTDVFVTVPGLPRRVAKIVATDTTRMLTLLKVEANGLPVPEAVPKHEMHIGQWTLALGRTLPPEITDPPSVSAGILSAVDRLYGKAIQTDAKVSPVNYGGPLVALDGRVLGVLVPASPRGEGETAGVEWYDSGIGFAIPLVDVLAVLPRLREGIDLRKGILGITPKSQAIYLDEPVIGTVSPDSAAERAGIQPGDVIVSINGQPMANFFQVQAALGPKYEGDVIDVVVRRGGQEIECQGVKLSGTVTAFNPGFLGILPMRDDPEAGVEIRYVFAGSPADQAGLKAGDRIVKASVPPPPGMPAPPVAPLKNRDGLLEFINQLRAGTEIKLEVKRAGSDKLEKLQVRLAAVPECIPPVLPLPSTRAGHAAGAEAAGNKPLPDAEDKPGDPPAAATGLLKRKHAVLGREYWLYVPKNYRPEVAHGLIVWLHDAGKGGRDAEDVVKIWGSYLEQTNFIMLGPISTNADGWLASETEGVVQDIKEVLETYTVDKARMAAHGQGVGGQMAAYLGFNAREQIRAVAMTQAPLGTAPKDHLPGQRLCFFIIAGDRLPNFKTIEAAPPALREKKIPTIWRPIKDFGNDYMNQETLTELAHWLDSLDRI